MGILRYKEPKLNILKRLFNNEENTEIAELNKIANTINFDSIQLDEKGIESEINSFQYIFDHLTTGIWMREEPHGDLLYASKGFEEILNLPLKTIYETPSLRYRMVHPMHKKKWLLILSSLPKGKRCKCCIRLQMEKSRKSGF